MGAIVNQLAEFAVGMWRFRWLALGLAWFIAIAGWLFVAAMPDEYEASSRVFLDTETVINPLLDGLQVETDVMNEVALMTRSMRSRPMLERVARATDLDLRVETREELEELLALLQDRIEIIGGRDKMFSIAYTDSDRQKAVDVVQTLLDTFVEDTLGGGAEDSIQAEQTLRAQIREYEDRLVSSEQRLTEFKQRNIGRMPSDMGDYYTQLQSALDTQEQAKQAVSVTELQLRELNRQLKGEVPTFGMQPGSVMDPLSTTGGASRYDGQIARAKGRLSQLLVDYTERYPEVVRINAVLADLEAKRKAELEENAAAGLAGEPAPSMATATNMLDVNPVYQSIKMALSEKAVDMARLRATLAQSQARVTQLRGLVNIVPQVEAELASLNRDYSVVKERYETMLERMEDLQTSQKVKSGTDQIQFRIIDPPFAPLDAVGPNRPLLFGMILIVALSFGVALAFALNQLQPVFSTRKGLETAHELPVIGTCDLFLTGGAKLRRRVDELSVTAFVLGLFVVCSVTVVFSDQAAEIVRRVVEGIGQR